MGARRSGSARKHGRPRKEPDSRPCPGPAPPRSCFTGAKLSLSANDDGTVSARGDFIHPRCAAPVNVREKPTPRWSRWGR